MEQKNKSGNRRGLNSAKSYFQSKGDNQPKLITFQKNELIGKTAEWICEGLPSSEIVDKIRFYSPVQITLSHSYRLLNHAIGRMGEISKQDALTILNVHVSHYEKIYRYFNSIGNVKGMNAAMKGKERLLGLLKDANKVVINRTINTTVEASPPYDFTKLNTVEKARLDELLDKMKS